MSDDPTRSRECTGDDFIDDFKRALGVEQFERCERPALNTVPMGFHYARWKEKTPAGIVEHVATIIFRECQPCSLVFRTWEDEPRACPGCEASEAGRPAELAAARKVIDVVRDKQAPAGADIPHGVEYVRRLVNAISAYDAMKGPGAP